MLVHQRVPRNSFGFFFCRRQIFVELTPETRKNAGIPQKCRRIQKMPDLQVYVKTTKYRKDTNLCNRIGVSGSRSWVIDPPKFDLTDSSLSPLHALGKFPAVNRNYLPAFVFTIFKVFPLLFQYKKECYNFTIDLKWRTGLKWWPRTSTIKDAMCLRIGFG